MIQKPWLLLAPLVVLLTVYGATTFQAAESSKAVTGDKGDWTEEYKIPKAAKSEPVRWRWALMVATPGGDPVELSRWRYRETCEMVRKSMARMALRTGAAVPGTQCDALSWRIWLRYFLFGYLPIERGKTLDGERWTPDFDVEEYLEKAVNRTLQQDVASEFGTPLLVKELATGQTVWTYESGFRIISLDGKKLLTPPHFRCYILTFDQDKILRERRSEYRQGNCSGPPVPVAGLK